MGIKPMRLRVSEGHLQELRLLKEAWGLKSIDEVLERLITAHRVEKIKALGIIIEEPYAAEIQP